MKYKPSQDNTETLKLWPKNTEILKLWPENTEILKLCREILKHIRAASNPADSSQSRGKGAAGAILSPFPEVSVN